MTKRYSLSALSRFILWPYKALFGQTRTYTLDNDKNVYFEKLPRSTHTGSQFMAALLFPISLPFAALVSVKRFIFNNDSRDIATEKKRLAKKSYKKQIANAQTTYQHRTAESLLKEFDDNEKILLSEWAKLSKRLTQSKPAKSGTTENLWEDAEIINKIDLLFSGASLNFTILLIAMRKMIDQEQTYNGKDLSDPATLAKRIVTQPQNLPPGFKGAAIPYRFMYSTLIDIYHTMRARPHITEEDAMVSNGIDVRSHAQLNAFYSSDKPEYTWRQAYNANMKLFYSLFGGNKFRSTLHAADERFDYWTKIDTSKNEKSFQPYPGFRPT